MTWCWYALCCCNLDVFVQACELRQCGTCCKCVGFSWHHGQAQGRQPMSSWLSDGTEEYMPTAALAAWLTKALGNWQIDFVRMFGRVWFEWQNGVVYACGLSQMWSSPMLLRQVELRGHAVSPARLGWHMTLSASAAVMAEAPDQTSNLPAQSGLKAMFQAQTRILCCPSLQTGFS